MVSASWQYSAELAGLWGGICWWFLLAGNTVLSWLGCGEVFAAEALKH